MYCRMLPPVHWSPYIFAIQQLTSQRLLAEWSEHKSFFIAGLFLACLRHVRTVWLSGPGIVDVVECEDKCYRR